MNIEDVRTQITTACTALKAWIDADPLLEEVGDDHPFCKLGEALIAARDALKAPVSVAAEDRFPRLLFQESEREHHKVVAAWLRAEIGAPSRPGRLTAETRNDNYLSQEEIAEIRRTGDPIVGAEDLGEWFADGGLLPQTATELPDADNFIAVTSQVQQDVRHKAAQHRPGKGRDLTQEEVAAAKGMLAAI